jgi:alanine-glyoxylate transaminase/serine-glyoxylate transaminase/serine-pyruvate transaminase
MCPFGGEPYLQTPGPTNVPLRVLRAIAKPTIDHRGPDFAVLTLSVLERLQQVFATAGPVVVYPSSGTGAWEAALVNTLSPADRVLAYETGHFSTLWAELAENLGLDVELIPGDWRHPVDADAIEDRLRRDPEREIKAVMVVHNETSTGVRSAVPAVREALDAADHPALLLVDTVSSLASMDFKHDAWGVDVTVSGSQKGLMLPPGLGFNAVSDKALAAAKEATLPRAYWDWAKIIAANRAGFFPYTPATNLLFGLDESLAMLLDEGLPAVFARHDRQAAATRAAAAAWGLEVVCADDGSYSSSLTALLVPQEFDSARVCATALEQFGLSLGIGLGKLSGAAFRIGHLGYLSDLSLVGALSGVERTLRLEGIPVPASGVAAAVDALGGN